MELEYKRNPLLFEKVPFVEYAMNWLEISRARNDSGTYKTHKQHVIRHIIPFFKEYNLTIQEIRPFHIEEYYAAKMNSGRLDGKQGGLCRSTLKRHSTVLHLIFSEAKKNHIINENPCDYAGIPKQGSRIIKQMEIYTEDDCKRLLELVKGEILYDMVYISFIYGLRRSELMGLRWQDIDFEGKSVSIQHTAVVYSDGSTERRDTTKTKSSNRTYPLSDGIRDILLKRREHQEENRAFFGNAYHDSDYVFTHDDGSVFYPGYPSHRLHRVITQYNLPHIVWHGLRHSCASMLIKKGW